MKKKWFKKEKALEDKAKSEVNKGIVGFEENVQNSKKWTLLTIGGVVVIVAVIFIILAVTKTI